MNMDSNSEKRVFTYGDFKIFEKNGNEENEYIIQWKEWLYKRVQIETASENKLISKRSEECFFKENSFYLKWSETILFPLLKMNIWIIISFKWMNYN